MLSKVCTNTTGIRGSLETFLSPSRHICIVLMCDSWHVCMAFLFVRYRSNCPIPNLTQSTDVNLIENATNRTDFPFRDAVNLG